MVLLSDHATLPSASAGAGKARSAMRLALVVAAAVVMLGAGLVATPATAQEIKTVTKKGDFEDVKFELNDAIVRRGLSVEQDGNIGQMLERTGADVGSTTPIYRNARFLSFCSARFSRRMMEADPVNLGFCPYVVFIYESVAAPGEIVVGYRTHPPRGNEASRAALAEIDQLLDGIIKDAVK
jgi:uncharacterized protein (DUF302 family)